MQIIKWWRPETPPKPPLVERGEELFFLLLANGAGYEAAKRLRDDPVWAAEYDKLKAGGASESELAGHFHDQIIAQAHRQALPQYHHTL